MEYSTTFELWLAGCSLLFGAVGMLLFDLFRIWRQAFPAGRISTDLQDLLYWTLLTLGCLAFLLFANRGQPRVFILVCALLGALLYRVTAGRLVMLAGGSAARVLQAIRRKGANFFQKTANFFQKTIVKLQKICDNTKNETDGEGRA